jgi:hypothetical protein
MKIDCNSFPPNTKFLYNKLDSGFVCEDSVVEWSPSNFFVKLEKSGWLSKTELSDFVVLEILWSPNFDALDKYGVPLTFHREETG